MYNLLTVKSDILTLGSFQMTRPEQIYTFKRKGYDVYESYRVFDETHELDVILGKQNNITYLIVSNPNTKDYQVEMFNGKTLIEEIRHLNRDGLKALKQQLSNDTQNDKGIRNKLVNTDLRNKMQICINGIRLKTIGICCSILMLGAGVTSFLINN